MIKTIIFDFGDVFLDLDKPATARELEKLGISELSQEMIHKNQLYEKGLMSSEDFIRHYCLRFPELSRETFSATWNSILVKFPRHRLEFLQKLKSEKPFKLILLSNTNDIHIAWVRENISFFQEFKDCFDAFYLSHEIKLRKPDSEIFEFVLQKNRIKAEETLFIDDTFENIQAADLLGFHTWNIDPQTQDVTELFSVKSSLF